MGAYDAWGEGFTGGPSVDLETTYGIDVTKGVTLAAEGDDAGHIKVYANGNLVFDVVDSTPITGDYYGILQFQWSSANTPDATYVTSVVAGIDNTQTEPEIVVDVTTPDDGIFAGDEVTVDLVIKNNPGIAGLVVTLKYDDSVLTLKNVSNGTLFSGFANGLNISWDEIFDVTEDGVLATLTFVVAEGAEAGDYTIEVLVRECINVEFEDLEATGVSGTITVTEAAEEEILWGDVNGDGEVNAKDATKLKKYLANYDPDTETSTETVEAGADANGDGEVNAKDATKLKKYLANYDPDTGTSTEVLGPQ
jgi:hypothetical protein